MKNLKREQEDEEREVRERTKRESGEETGGRDPREGLRKSSTASTELF